MLRLAEPHGGPVGATTARRGERPLNAISLIQSVRSLRTDYFARMLRRGLETLVREAGLSNLFATCCRRVRKHRTLRALQSLDDRLLNDIGVQRADIEATAALCCEGPPAGRNTRWYGLSAWASREAQRRRFNGGHKRSTAA